MFIFQCSSKSQSLSSTRSRTSNTISSTTLAVLKSNASFLSNRAPTFAVRNLSGSQAFAESAKATFISAIEGSHGFVGKAGLASLAFLAKALVDTGCADSVGQRGDRVVRVDVVEGLSGGHGHDK